MGSKRKAAQSIYEKDFIKWVEKQAALLKSRDFLHLDLENLIEEIESLGRSDRRALKSHLIILLHHLLKRHFLPEMKKNSNSIENARIGIKLILEDSPSLNIKLNSMIESAYPFAVKAAAAETEMDVSCFPEECPWTKEEILDVKKKRQR